MLRRTSIRNKLLVALGLLTAIVLLLAFSGFWGLYRYEQLAEAVSQRATKLPMANDLNRFAETLRDSNSRMKGLLVNGGMIDAGLLENPLMRMEQTRYAQALLDMNLRLQRYEDSIAGLEKDSTMLVDIAREQRSVGEMRQSVAAIEKCNRTPHCHDHAHHTELSGRLDTLVDQTRDHLALLHGGMAKFSQDVRGQYSRWIMIAWFCTVLSVLMVGLLLWTFHSHVVKPFRTLLGGSRLVASGQLDHRIDLGTGDELSELAIAMNEMTNRFQKAYAKVNLLCDDLDCQVQARTREVIQNEQLASVGFLAAGVAHEINNPLATIAWSAESLESRVLEAKSFLPEDNLFFEEFNEAMTTNLRRIQDEAFRCKGITERLLDFSRLNEVRRAETNMTQMVGDIVAMVSKVGKFRCKTLRVVSSEDVVAHVNPQEMRQVVLNLITNALESVDTDGAVDVIVQSEGDHARVTVKDNGCGMTPDVLKHLFEPFFTRRRDGTGTGLGLSITYRIVSQHGGSLVASSAGEGKGSTMEVLLPSVPDQDEQFTKTNRDTIGWDQQVSGDPATKDEVYDDEDYRAA